MLQNFEAIPPEVSAVLGIVGAVIGVIDGIVKKIKEWRINNSDIIQQNEIIIRQNEIINELYEDLKELIGMTAEEELKYWNDVIDSYKDFSTVRNKDWVIARKQQIEYLLSQGLYSKARIKRLKEELKLLNEVLATDKAIVDLSDDELLNYKKSLLIEQDSYKVGSKKYKEIQAILDAIDAIIEARIEINKLEEETNEELEKEKETEKEITKEKETQLEIALRYLKHLKAVGEYEGTEVEYLEDQIDLLRQMWQARIDELELANGKARLKLDEIENDVVLQGIEEEIYNIEQAITDEKEKQLNIGDAQLDNETRGLIMARQRLLQLKAMGLQVDQADIDTLTSQIESKMAG